MSFYKKIHIDHMIDNIVKLLMISIKINLLANLINHIKNNQLELESSKKIYRKKEKYKHKMKEFLIIENVMNLKSIFLN